MSEEETVEESIQLDPNDAVQIFVYSDLEWDTPTPVAFFNEDGGTMIGMFVFKKVDVVKDISIDPA